MQIIFYYIRLNMNKDEPIEWYYQNLESPQPLKKKPVSLLRAHMLNNKANEFNVNDPNQQFYCWLAPLKVRDNLLSTFGWRVCVIEGFEQDLILLCLALLQQVQDSFNLVRREVMIKNQNEEETKQQSIWIQIYFYASMDSINTQSDFQDTYFGQVFRFFEFSLIPKVRTFFKENITNLPMQNNNQSSQRLSDRFQEEIITLLLAERNKEGKPLEQRKRYE